MTKSAVPTSPNAPGSSHPEAAAGAHPAIETLDEQLLRVWKNHRQTITGICVVLLVAIVGVYGWRYFQARKDADLSRQFGAANTSAELKAFVAANAGHPLAGLAQLRMADEAYTAGQYSEAIAAYEQAGAVLKGSSFAERAKLGAAVAQVSSGQVATGEPVLKQISNDTSLSLNIRTEATYHLVNLAAAAGRAEDVNKLSDQILQLDPSSPWAQRAMMLRANFPAAMSAAPSPLGSGPLSLPPVNVPIR